MSRYIKTKADFTIRRKHKSGSGVTIYENDYKTINPMPNALKGEYTIGDSNFVFTSRLGINAQKKHVRNKFIAPSENSAEGKIAWTIENMPFSGVTNETKVRLKPNYNSIKDFACYGSAVKLIQGTVNGVITDFPAEMFLSGDELKLYAPDEGYAGYSFNDENDELITGNILYNEYAIDITTKSIRAESVYNPLRYFALCGSSYTYIEGETEFDFVSFTSTTNALGRCHNGKSVWVDKLGEITLVFSNGSVTKTINIAHFKDYRDDSEYYIYTGGQENGHIRPKKSIIEDYFLNCDDFTAVLLDRTTNPIYTSVLETPKETETGYVYDMVSYTWSSSLGGYNPNLSGGYYAYVESLMQLAEFYDEFFSDNMWRSLTHEAIKTLDWTYVSNTDGDIQDLSTIDTSRIEPITKIYGRQFDDLKRYADGIKYMNTVTYNQKSNMPDYTLVDALENSGWETKTLKITSDNALRTEPLYPAHSSGYTASDTNSEFFRRLKLNSRYLFSVKGTRKGLDSMLGMFGFKPDEYDIHEYVYVFSSKGHYPHFCNDTEGNELVKYPLAKDVATINKYKANFNTFDPYGDYCGIPVTEVGCWKDGKDCSYVVPWYSNGKKYDDGLYFQMNGGWGKRKHLEINLDIAPGVTEITDMNGEAPIYLETQARLKFASDFDDLLQEAYAQSNLHDVFYVTDISKITTDYSSGETEDIQDASHYFVLENQDHNQFLGYSEESGKYGWRSITNTEIQNPDASTAGTLVLYLETIKDNTTGNNPHIGNGLYDGGSAYIESMSQVFNYSLINKNFIGIDDNTCSDIAKYTFDVEEQEDNRKCWFFTDNYNSGFGKTVVYNTPSKKPEKEEDCGNEQKIVVNSSEKIDFREVDITNLRCHCDSTVISSGRCTDFANYNIEDLLASAGENKINQVGIEADKYMYNGQDDIYTRITDLKPFNPEDGGYVTNGEAVANSIVNVKKLVINFNLSNFMNACGEEPDIMKKIERYIEATVIPYLEQMIPATSILEWTYTFGEETNVPVTATFEQTDD